MIDMNSLFINNFSFTRYLNTVYMCGYILLYSLPYILYRLPYIFYSLHYITV